MMAETYSRSYLVLQSNYLNGPGQYIIDIIKIQICFLIYMSFNIHFWMKILILFI